MNTKFIYVFAKLYGYRSISRTIPYIISMLMMPLALLFIFHMISPSQLFPFAILGGMISILITNGLNTLFDTAQFRLNFKTQDLLVATELTPTSYLMGMILGELVFAAPSIAVYGIIGAIYHVYTLAVLPAVICVFLLLYLTVASIAFFISGFPIRFRGVWGYTNILVILLSLLPPIYYPYTYLPKPLLYAFLLLPTTSASILLQAATGLSKPFAPAAYLFIAEMVISVVLATKLTRWRSR